MYVLVVPPTMRLRDVLPRIRERVPQLPPDEGPPSMLNAPVAFELPPQWAAPRGKIARRHNELTLRRLLMRISQERSAGGAHRPSIGDGGPARVKGRVDQQPKRGQ
jgi:hypothetical protein